jgi:hypothetical protein
MMCLGHGDIKIVLSMGICPMNRGIDSQLMLIYDIYVMMMMMTMRR